MAASTPTFNTTIHLMRGLGILLVVVGHSLDTLGDATVARASHAIIYSFHMHLFFFISGFVGSAFFRSLPGRRAGLVWKQFNRLFVVYLFYTCVATLVKIVLRDFVSRPVQADRLLRDVLLYPSRNPLINLWFVYVLFLMQMLFLAVHALLRPDYGRRSPILVGLVVMIGLSVASHRFLPAVLGINTVAYYAIWFWLGHLVSQRAVAAENLVRRLTPLVLVAMGGFVAYDRIGHVWPFALFYTAVGILLVWGAALRLARYPGRLQSVVNLLGWHSYDIYLMSGFFQIGARVLFGRFLGWHSGGVFVMDLLLGLTAPVILAKYVMRRSFWLRWLALGAWVPRTAVAASPAEALQRTGRCPS